MSAVAFLMMGKMLSTFYIDRIKDYDYRVAFRWGLFVIAPAPFFWLFSDHFPYILALQLISGTAYGFFELGLALMFFKDLNPDEKIPFLTFYNMFDCLGLLVGSALGGIWLRTQNSELKAYYYLFFIGGCLRLVGSWLLISQSKKLQYQSKIKE
jgi:MFS family permease